ncbi:MAG: hypothetical protein J5798_05330 [Spirochaetaceae bacterium]|nr:hypothetical protein [Spirochaetaceae bacterium]MBR4824530.1 hypothetical protein [Spirochaetaceae bacterium]
MQKLNHKAAKAVLFAFLAAFIIFSCFFVIIEKDHDCCGEKCEICLIIQIAQQNIQLLRIILCLIAATYAFFRKSAKGSFCFPHFHIKTQSLFLQKTRLND